jgi:hypothetical protein
MGGKMQKFKHNGQDIRFFENGEDVYFVTADANRAFGFSGQNTSIDNVSVNVDTLAVEDRISSLNQSDGIEGLQRGILVLTLPNLITAVIRSNKPNTQSLADIFVQMAAKSFMTPLTHPPERKALPAATDSERAGNLAKAIKGRKLKLSRTRVDSSDWQTAQELFTQAAKAIGAIYLRKDNGLHYGFNRHIADFYRQRSGEDPPSVRRKGTAGFCYPAIFESIARAYLTTWVNTKKP